MAFGLGFIYAALPPEVNVVRLLAGGGSAPMLATAAAASSTAHLLTDLATTTERQIQTLLQSWQGEGADAARPAWGRYTDWLLQLAAIAQLTSTQAANQAQAYSTAVTMSPNLAEIIANRAAMATLAATNVLGGATGAAMLGVEADYMRMWIQAAIAMGVYDVQTTANTNALQSPSNAPQVGLSKVTSGAQTAMNGISQVVSQAQAQQRARIPSSGSGANVQLPPELAGSSLLGAAPVSSLLAGLQGDSNVEIPIGLVSGSLGNMPGMATGFALPGNWEPATPPGGLGPAPGSALTPAGSGLGAPYTATTAPRTTVRENSLVSVPDGGQVAPGAGSVVIVDPVDNNDDGSGLAEIEPSDLFGAVHQG